MVRSPCHGAGRAGRRKARRARAAATHGRQRPRPAGGSCKRRAWMTVASQRALGRPISFGLDRSKGRGNNHRAPSATAFKFRCLSWKVITPVWHSEIASIHRGAPRARSNRWRTRSLPEGQSLQSGERGLGTTGRWWHPGYPQRKKGVALLLGGHQTPSLVPHLMQAPVGDSSRLGPVTPNQGYEVVDLHTWLVPHGEP